MLLLSCRPKWRHLSFFFVSKTRRKSMLPRPSRKAVCDTDAKNRVVANRNSYAHKCCNHARCRRLTARDVSTSVDMTNPPPCRVTLTTHATSTSTVLVRVGLASPLLHAATAARCDISSPGLRVQRRRRYRHQLPKTIGSRGTLLRCAHEMNA